MTININGDSIDTYGNIYDDPMFIPSDSTLVYSWDLDVMEFLKLNANPYNDYGSNWLEILRDGYMNFIYGNIWI